MAQVPRHLRADRCTGTRPTRCADSGEAITGSRRRPGGSAGAAACHGAASWLADRIRRRRSAGGGASRAAGSGVAARACGAAACQPAAPRPSPGAGRPAGARWQAWPRSCARTTIVAGSPPGLVRVLQPACNSECGLHSQCLARLLHRPRHLRAAVRSLPLPCPWYGPQRLRAAKHGLPSYGMLDGSFRSGLSPALSHSTYFPNFG